MEVKETMDAFYGQDSSEFDKDLEAEMHTFSSENKNVKNKCIHNLI